MDETEAKSEPEPDIKSIECDDEDAPITTTTKNALITTQLDPCDVYPHRVKVSIVGVGKIGIACAIAILMRRMASEVCLIDHDANKASAEAEDIQHVGFFLGCPLVTGTSEISTVKESAVVIICTPETPPGENQNVKHNLKVFKKIIPAIARFAAKSVLLIVTRPADVMSYIAWKLSGFPSNRVLGIGTLIDCARLQDFVSRRLNVARSSVSCMTIGSQGDMAGTYYHPPSPYFFPYHPCPHPFAVPLWSSISVGGMKLRDINSRIGEQDDPEKWYEIEENVKSVGKELEEKKGSCCWGVAISTTEIVDAIVRNTKVVLPASTHILSCAHGTDKDVYMSVPCVIGREGVYCTVRQKLSEQEKAAVQTCADNIRNILRESGILQENNNEAEQ
ncbi:L-lactate dehydrogenase A-like 6A isoform X1 [Apis mellifera]|uniref:L-lactate dehydrogenase A-like 6A isoform X1 n=1 Tax=Apis mellifera TaxID=7460 RepID=A0A7M7MKQ4_APIME|nr:L-lactate dehydrogenase A-like 6A isoform X1 [Apis mellifera]XP_026297430.1 L-lactate dehydrogenase A-like 6A isoform X1 [Apis mellifera]|eukprot:XP_006569455.1 L-lactate dehydrogenase A-like 6A isoform X1 [Apis mellifera]